MSRSCFTRYVGLGPVHWHGDYSWNTMTTTLPLESHKYRPQNETNLGSAYRNQALDLIFTCQLVSQIASPKCEHENAELVR